MITSSGLSVCIPIDLPVHGGGGFRFLQNFRVYLEQEGIPHTTDSADGARVLFTNSWHVSWTVILRAAWIRPDVTVIHRVDGSAMDYGRDPRADRIQSRVNLLADLTIFQSEYCRHSTRRKFPVIAHDGPVIHNPVDITLFTPEGERAQLPSFAGPRVVAVTWSTNRLKGASSIYRLAVALPKVQFVLCGRFDDAPHAPNIVRMGVLDATRLAATLRSCDALATFSQNEACPNVVLEGLATGLPILYLDSGATRELVEDCGLAVTEETFTRSLEIALARRGELAALARRRATERFAPSVVFPRYLEQIVAALRRVRPHRLERSAALLGSLARSGLT